MPGLPPVDRPEPCRRCILRLVLALPVLLVLAGGQGDGASPVDDPPMPDPCIRAPQLPFCR